MYRWWVLLHIIGAVGFLLSHGASTTVAFKLLRERDPRKVVTLIELSRSSMSYLYGSILILLVAGIVAGFMGGWWARGWIWAALFILIGLMVIMFVFGSRYYTRVLDAARIQEAGGSPVPGQDLRVILASPQPLVVAVIGFAGLLVILWLMVLKPF